MATIKLIGEIHPELVSLGLKEGDIIRNAYLCPTNKAMHFEVFYVITNRCVVYPENYEIIELSEHEKSIYNT